MVPLKSWLCEWLLPMISVGSIPTGTTERLDMNTIDTLRMFSDGRMSAHDARALMMSMGHSAQDFAEAFTALASEAGSSIRVSKWDKEEVQADLFLTTN